MNTPAKWFATLVHAGFLALVLPLSASAQNSVPLTFSVNPSSATQQEVYHLLAQQFELANPGVKVNVVSRSIVDHKRRLNDFIVTRQPPGDVILTYAGDQLNRLIQASMVQTLDDVWQAQNLDEDFSINSRISVSSDGHIYAVPLNYYHWGIYYKKHLFARLKLSPPQTWDELLNVVRTLNANGITPFTLSGGAPWTLAGWFDYLNLRLNGLAFHQQLLKGQHSFHDPKVKKVFAHWRQLIEAGAFDIEHIDHDWPQSLPYLYRDFIGMTLMGNFFIAHVPEPVKETLGFFAFPTIAEDVPRYENVPLDVAVVAAQSKNPTIAKRFVTYLADTNTQAKLSNYVGKIAANLNAEAQNINFLSTGREHIESSAGFAQFFDRDTPEAFSSRALPLLRLFVLAPQSEQEILAQLEQLRVQHLH